MSAPIIADFVPPLNATLRSLTAEIQFTVTDATALNRRTFVNVKFPGRVHDRVHDGTSFGLHYQNGSNRRVRIANGFQYTILRDGGWPAPPDLQIVAINQSGEESEF